MGRTSLLDVVFLEQSSDRLVLPERLHVVLAARNDLCRIVGIRTFLPLYPETHGKSSGISIRAGSMCTACPSSHSQPRTISAFGLRSQSAMTPKVSEVGCAVLVVVSVSLLVSVQTTGRRTALGLQPLRMKWDLLPAMWASRERSSGAPSRWTNGFGRPRWA